MLIGCHLMEINCYYLVCLQKFLALSLKGFENCFMNFNWIIIFDEFALIRTKLNEFSCTNVFNILSSDCIASFSIFKQYWKLLKIRKCFLNFTIECSIELTLKCQRRMKKIKLRKKNNEIRLNFPNKHYVIQNETSDG